MAAGEFSAKLEQINISFSERITNPKTGDPKRERAVEVRGIFRRSLETSSGDGMQIDQRASSMGPMMMEEWSAKTGADIKAALWKALKEDDNDLKNSQAD